jgi:two-component sensor histidine kinase
MALMQSRADRETACDVMVTSAQTQAVAFVFHELVANAPKYGAPYPAAVRRSHPPQL